MTAWCKVPSSTSGLVLFDFAQSGNKNEISFGISSGGVVYSRNSDSTGAATTVQSSSGVIVANRWHHVAVVISGTSCSIYVDGNLVKTGTTVTPASVSRTSNYVGKSNLASDTVTYVGSTGWIDDLNYYNTALTQYQVKLVLNIDSG